MERRGVTSRNGAVVRWSERLTRPVTQAWLLLALVVSVGCAAAPSPRLDAYLGRQFSKAPQAGSERIGGGAGPLVAGLLLVNDTTAPGSAPALSDQGRAFLIRRVKEAVERATLFKISTSESTASPLSGDLPQLIVGAAREQGVDYLLVVLVSGAESEVPTRLSLGGPESTAVPGVEIQHHALTELALLDVTRGALLARATGRAWAVLEELALSIQSHHYPVIRRSNGMVWLLPGVPAARDLVRVVAAEESVDQAIPLLASGWDRATAPDSARP